MKDHPPLSYRDLKTIQEGNRRHPDVMTLLREVKRLRELVAITFGALSRIPMNQIPMETVDMIAMFDALRAEPAVQEYIRMEAKRQEMEFRRSKVQEAANVRQDQAGQEPAGVPGVAALESENGAGSR
ncbi:hypothetical protein H0A73_17575 [Alcaligenaceae bacterium]|nr:hypothetical protein [Alcaligenaceae bacterium]